MPKVYVANEPTRWNRERQVREPVHDLSPARQWGELVFAYSGLGVDLPQDPEIVLRDLRQTMAGFGPEDYVVTGVGHPLVIAWVIALAAQKTDGQLNLLHWGGKRSPEYLLVRAQVWTNPETTSTRRAG